MSPRNRRRAAAAAGTFIALLIGSPAHPAEPEPEPVVAPPADRLVAAIREPALRELVAEVLERNPRVAAGRFKAEAAAQRAPQVRALPDPVASLTAYLETPETRVGPQRLMAGLFQGLPWFGKLALKEQAALYEAAALEAEVEAARLELVTEARRLAYELAFLARYREINEEFRDHLLQHEEISRARYSTGVGLGQGVVKLQAEITRVENTLLEIETRRAELAAQLNGLRDRPAGEPIRPPRLPDSDRIGVETEPLIDAALRFRPELAAADLRIARAETLIELAEKGYKPDFTVGLVYTFIDPRQDPAGRLSPPHGNGDDILGIQGGVTVPVRRKKLAAGVEEALRAESAARESKRDVAVRIRSAIGDLAQRIPLSWEQLRLVEDLLVIQAEEALESAKAGYVAGTLNALDLLDAEHVLFAAQTAVARAAADYLIALARMEGAIGDPLAGGKQGAS